MKEFELFGLKFKSEREVYSNNYSNEFGFRLRGVEIDQKYIEISNGYCRLNTYLVPYCWEANELEEDAIILLNHNIGILEFIFRVDQLLKDQTSRYEKTIKINNSITKEIEKLDKYRILL